MKKMNSNKSVKPSKAKVLLAASLLGQLGGVWLATICYGFFTGGDESFASILMDGLKFIGFGFQFMLFVWVLVTLPCAALCLHFEINQKIILTTLIGGVCGIPAWAALSTFLLPGTDFTLEMALGGAGNGAFIAAGFSLLSRKWGKIPEDDIPLPSRTDG